jgi:hypothetical protein
MNQHKKTVLATCIIVAVSRFGYAHEADTHAALGVQAWQQSTLVTDPVVRANLGLDRDDVTAPFRNVPPLLALNDPQADDYFDVMAPLWSSVNSISNPGAFAGAFLRMPSLFDSINMVDFGFDFRNETGANLAYLQAWLMRGEIREDDLRIDTDYPNESVANRPDPDPNGDIVRVFHHFYDPVHDSGLQPVGLPSGTCSGLPGGDSEGCSRSPDWALGVTGSTIGSPTPNATRRNHFSYRDAREAYYCWLTHREASGQTPAAASRDRNYCLATAFKSLGQVMHLVQDTSQPQHVRDDGHNPPSGLITALVATSPQRRTFEIWGNYLMLRNLDPREVSAPRSEVNLFTNWFNKAEPAVAAFNPDYTLILPPKNGHMVKRFFGFQT